jgi:hypothetical protein
MGRIYQSSETISLKAAPQKVFSHLTNWEQRQRACPKVKLNWDGKPEAYLHQKVRFRKSALAHWTIQVTGLELGRRMFFEYVEGPLRGRAAVETIPEGDGCKATFYWMKVEPYGWVSRLYFGLGLGYREHAKGMFETLDTFKEYLEKNP